MAEPYGIKIGYHNHSQEFFMDEGKTLLEHLLDNSTKCYSQLDCGWAQNGGCYPPSFIRRYKNRFVAIHVKENSKVQAPARDRLPATRQKRQATPIRLLMSKKCRSKSARRFWTALTRT